jgi:hypothetical protein
MNDPQASKQPDSPLELATLTRTSLACPSQWEGTLEDGRAIYVRYRHGELSVGIGRDIDDAVRNGMSDQALYTADIGDRLDGFMNTEELTTRLHGLLKLPADIAAQSQSQPD